jgi:hypothetical protein
MEKQGKWEFLKPLAQNIMAEEPDLSITGVAGRLKDRYYLKLDTEAIRKIISRLLNQSGSPLDMTSRQISQELVNQGLVKPNPVYQTKPIVKTFSIESPGNKPVLHTKITKPGNYLILGCWHVPFQNKEFTKRVFDLMNTHKFDGLILNGDFLDCNTLSGHDRGKFTAIRGLTLTEEYRQGKEVLKQLVELLPANAEKVYMYGNHEDRYFRFIGDMQQAKTPPQSPTEGLGLYDLGFQVVESYATGYMTLGEHLDILHGIYYNTHCAKTHIDRFRGSVVFAHTHRIQSYIEGRTGGFNIGWGGDATSPAFNYADRGTKASWQNGLAVETIDERGNYYHQQVVAQNNRFVYGGKLY